MKATKKKTKSEKEKMAPKKSEKLIDKKGFRLDGRKVDELRPVKMEVGVLPNADGSAYLEQGRNKILVGVYGPKEAHPRHIARQDRAVIQCRYHMAPFSVDERKSPAPSRRDVELSIERAFTGEELVLRMKGWDTTDVEHVIEIIKPYGYIKVLDEEDLVVELESEEDYEKAINALKEKFGDQVFLERL